MRRGPRLAIAAGAFALVAVLILMGIPSPAGGAVRAQGPLSGAGTGLPPAEAAYAAELGKALGFSPAKLSGAESWLAGLSSSQLTLLKEGGAHPSSSELKALGVHTAAGFDYTCFGAFIVAGALIGAGSGAGAIIGGVAGALIGYYSCQQAGVNVGPQYTNWALGVTSAFGNEVNQTEVEFQNIMSALNFSAVGFQRSMDNAATLQIQNSTFSVGADLAQSGVATQLSQVASAYALQDGNALTILLSELSGNAGPGAAYASASPGLCPTTVSSPCSTASASGTAVFAGLSSVQAYGPWTNSATAVGVDLTHGSTLVFAEVGATGGVVTIKDDIHPGHYYNWTIPTGNIWYNESFPGPTSYYSMTLSSNSFAIYLENSQMVPTSTSSGIGGLGAATQEPYSIKEPDSGSAQVSGYAASIAFGTDNPDWNPVTPYYTTNPGAVGSGNLGTWLGAIEWTAALQAQAYWQFLRTAGWTSVSQIPPDCLVPAPWMILPSAINSTSLNTSEWESLYLGTLEGLGHFYNVSLNSTSFCGTQAVKKFSIGNAPWGNLFINATGDIYLNNGTAPITQSGKRLSTEVFSNLSTWALTGQQLYIMPTISTVSIPVGVRWAIPNNDPVEIYAIQATNTLWLTGNGTGAGNCSGKVGSFCSALLEPMATLSPGDSIYLTSCTVGGSAKSTCTITVQTVNTTVAALTCVGPCSQGAPNGGFFGNLPNPFSWLANAICGLFGFTGLCNTPLGSLLASIVADLLILGGIALIAYVLVVEVRAWGQKKRDGAPKRGA